MLMPWLRWCLSGFSTEKLLLFPLYWISNLEGGIFRLCESPLPHPHFTQYLKLSLMTLLLESTIMMIVNKW